MKTCKVCTRIKETTEFYKNSNYKDGLEYRCKACRKEAYPTAKRTLDTKRYRAYHGYPIYSKKRMDTLLEERTKEILEIVETYAENRAYPCTFSHLRYKLKTKYVL